MEQWHSMREHEPMSRDTNRAVRYEITGVAGMIGGYFDLARRAHMITTDYLPADQTIYTAVKGRIEQFGQGNAAIIDLLIMGGGLLALMGSAMISETPKRPRALSPLAGKEFPHDIYDLERSSNF